MDIQSILKSTRGPEWRPVGEPTEETKQVQNPITGVTQTVGTGEYVLTITDGKITRPIKLKMLSAAVPGHPAGAGTTDADAAYSSGSAADWALLDAGADSPSRSADAVTWTQQFTSTNGGVTTRYGTNSKTGKVELIPGAPSETAPGKATPTPLTDYVEVKGPDGSVIALADPKDPTNRIPVPAGASSTKPSIVNGAGGAIYSWDGTNLTLKQAGTAPDVKPIEGQTRPNVAGGYSIQEVFRGGNWVTDPSVTPKPFDPSLSGKAKENDTRPNTDNKGQKIQEIFKGGSWVTDTSVAPQPFGTQAPVTLNTGTAPFIVQQDPTTGKTTNLPNPNTTDIAARVGQLQQTARAKSDELKQQVASGAKTAEQAAAEFDAFWSTTIDPQSQQLNQAQQQSTYDAQQKQREQARLEESQRNSNLSTAQAAGQNAVSNATNFGPGVQQVGPGYGAAMSNIMSSFASGKAPAAIDGNSLTWQAPDMNDLATKATAAALAHISPTAAQIAGRPMPQIPQGLDVAGALNKSTYAPKTTIAPDGTITVDHQPQPPAPIVPTGPTSPQFMFGAGPGAVYTPPAYSPPF